MASATWKQWESHEITHSHPTAQPEPPRALFSPPRARGMQEAALPVAALSAAQMRAEPSDDVFDSSLYFYFILFFLCHLLPVYLGLSSM